MLRGGTSYIVFHTQTENIVHDLRLSFTIVPCCAFARWGQGQSKSISWAYIVAGEPSVSEDATETRSAFQ